MSLLWVIPFASHSLTRVGRAVSAPSPPLPSSPLPCTCTRLCTLSSHIVTSNYFHYPTSDTRLWRGVDRSQRIKTEIHFWIAATFFCSTLLSTCFFFLSVSVCVCASFFFSRCFFATVGQTLVMSLKDCHDCRPTSEKSAGSLCDSEKCCHCW